VDFDLTYQRAAKAYVADGCQPGAQALEDWAVAHGFGELGCFNNRPIRGTTDTLSVHAEGRAIDLFPTIGSPTMYVLVSWLTDSAPELGVQLIIYDRQVWTFAQGWRDYTGPAGEHLDHAHIELTRSAAALLDDTAVAAVLDPLYDEAYSDDESEADMAANPTLYRPAGYANVFAIFASGEVLHCDTALVELFGGADAVKAGDAVNEQTLHSLLAKAGLGAGGAVPLAEG
jgi:hypothetical protein